MEFSTIEFSTQTISSLSNILKPGWSEWLSNFGIGLIGAAIGAGATIWATIKTLKANVRSQREEFDKERLVKRRSTWKGLYSELLQIKEFLENKESSSGLGICASLSNRYLSEIHPFLSIAPNDIAENIRSLGSLVGLHNDISEHAKGQNLNTLSRIDGTIKTQRELVRSKLGECIGKIENKSEEFLDFQIKNQSEKEILKK